MPFQSLSDRKPYYRDLLSLGFPIMIGQLGIILVGFVDNMMVGHHSTLELAAASFVNNFMNLAIVMGMGFSLGLTPLISESYAHGDGRLKSLLHSSLAANVLVGTLLTLVMGFLLLRIDLFRQPRELIQYITPYYAIQLASILVLMLFNAMKQFADGIGRTKITMGVMLTSNVLNIVFNYLLIYGKMGLPELGLVGAGLSTLGSRIFCVGAMWYLIRNGRSFRKAFEETESKRGGVVREQVRRLFVLGVPIGVQLGLEAASFSLAVIFIGWLGSIQLAAHQILSVVSTLGYMMYMGLTTAVTIRVSPYHARGDVLRIKQVVRAGFDLLLVMATSFVLALLLFRHRVGYIFTSDDELVRLVAAACIPIAVYQYGDLFQILFVNVLRGFKDVVYSAACAAFCHVVLALSLVYLLAVQRGEGVVGAWWAFPISLTTLGILLYLRYRKMLGRLTTQRGEDRT